MEHLLHELTDMNHLVDHFDYVLLIVSMLQRRMFRLRAFAIGSGLVEIVYRSFLVVDPVAVLWEAAFILVNVIQLIILWRDETHHNFALDEQHFVASMPSGIEKQALKRLVALADKQIVPGGITLIKEGEAVTDIIYVSEGIAQIEVGGKLLALCRPGDYLGEMSFLTGAKASATVTTVSPVRTLRFNQERLRIAVGRDTDMRRAVEAALNRNLVGKLARANADKLAAPPAATA